MDELFPVPSFSPQSQKEEAPWEGSRLDKHLIVSSIYWFVSFRLYVFGMFPRALVFRHLTSGSHQPRRWLLLAMIRWETLRDSLGSLQGVEFNPKKKPLGFNHWAGYLLYPLWITTVIYIHGTSGSEYTFCKVYELFQFTQASVKLLRENIFRKPGALGRHYYYSPSSTIQILQIFCNLLFLLVTVMILRLIKVLAQTWANYCKGINRIAKVCWCRLD